jgi:MFS family permease
VPLPAPLRPLESRDFRRYWAGQAVSLVGTWMQQMAQGWVITRLTSNATVVGALVVVGALPMAVLGLAGGQLADRVSRRTILLVTQAVMGLLALGLAALTFAGALKLPHLFAFAALLGVAAAFDLPAAQAFAPALVAREDIPRAIGLMQAIFHGSRLVGPALAGIVIERFGEGSAFLANGVSFLAVIVSLLSIRPHDGRARGRPTGGGPGEGIRIVRSDPLLRKLLALLLTCMLLAFPFQVALMAYFVRYVLHAQADDLGHVMSASGLGAVTGASMLVVVGARAWRTRITCGLVLITAGLVGLGATTRIGAAVALVTGLSLGISLYLGTLMQVVQQRTPDEVRGRVMALFTMGMTSVMPLSSLLLSAAADAVGLQRLMTVCGATFGVAAATIASLLPRAETCQETRREA